MKATNKSLIAKAEWTATSYADLIKRLPSSVVKDSYIEITLTRPKGKDQPDFKVLLKNFKGHNKVKQHYRPMKVFFFKYPRMKLHSTK